MAINFELLQPANIGGRIQAGQESAMRNQLAQQQMLGSQQQLQTGALQQQKAGLELQQFKRRQDALDSLMEEGKKIGPTSDPVTFAQNFVKFAQAHGDPQVLMAAQEALMAAQERKDYMARRMPGGAPAVGVPGGAPAVGMPAAPVPAGSEDRLGDFISQIEAKQNAPMPMPAVTGRPIQPEQALNVVSRSKGSPSPIPSANMLAPAAAAPVNALAADPAVEALQAKIMDLEIRYPRGAAKNEIARLTKQLDELQKTHVVGRSLVTNTGRKIYDAPESFAPPTSAAEYALAQKDPAFMEFLQKRAAATRTPAQPSAPVAVIDPKTGKQIFVSREEALRNRMAPATALEGLTPKDVQKREAAFPQATLSVKSYESKTDSFIKELEALRDDPGLDQITGSVYGRTPSVSREGSRAQAAYNKIFAKGGFQALQDLRESSKTGGALGNVSNQEGERLERSIVGGLDRTQNAEDVKQGINDLINDIKTSKTRIRDAYDMTYEYRSQRGQAAPAAGQGTGGFKYLGKASD
jgi:hypothetical protein